MVSEVGGAVNNEYFVMPAMKIVRSHWQAKEANGDRLKNSSYEWPYRSATSLKGVVLAVLRNICFFGVDR